MNDHANKLRKIATTLRNYWSRYDAARAVELAAMELDRQAARIRDLERQLSEARTNQPSVTQEGQTIDILRKERDYYKSCQSEALRKLAGVRVERDQYMEELERQLSEARTNQPSTVFEHVFHGPPAPQVRIVIDRGSNGEQIIDV